MPSSEPYTTDQLRQVANDMLKGWKATDRIWYRRASNGVFWVKTSTPTAREEILRRLHTLNPGQRPASQEREAYYEVRGFMYGVSDYDDRRG